MSAIFGVYHLQGQPVAGALMDGMEQALSAAGPDGQGQWCDGPVGLGYRLLHTTPESVYERQPLEHWDRAWILTADARLDNREELAQGLGIPHPARATTPDSALILAAYERWGTACPEHLLGDFAFALWDAHRRTLFCARDALGVKPFYYSYLQGRLFAFASQIAGLLSRPDVPRRLNDLALADYLVLRPGDPASTYFADCWRLPPAHTLQVRPEGLHLQRYWTLEPRAESRLASDAAYVEALRDLLRQAVHDRVRTVVPVGAHVTGGLDSSVVVCLAAARLGQAGQSLTGYTWSPPIEATDDPEEGEVPFILAVCRQAGLTLAAPTVTPEDIRDTLMLRTGPYGVIPIPTSELAMHAMMQAQGTRVVLSGWGGDEVASSHGQGYWAALAQQGHWLQLWRELGWLQQRHGGRRPTLFLSKVLFPFLPDALWWFYRRWWGRGLPPHPLHWSYIQPALVRRLQLAARWRAATLRERPGVHTNQLGFVLYGHLAARMEDWAADAGQRGVDYRYPLLDRRLLEWCLAVPPDQFVRQGWNRYLFQRAVDGLVPPRLPWQRRKADPVYKRKGTERRRALWPLLREPLALYAQHPLVPTYVDMPRLQACLERLIIAAAPLDLSLQQVGVTTALVTAAFVHRYVGI